MTGLIWMHRVGSGCSLLTTINCLHGAFRYVTLYVSTMRNQRGKVMSELPEGVSHFLEEYLNNYPNEVEWRVDVEVNEIFL